MRSRSAFLVSWLSATAAGAFTGMGGPRQEPVCAYACRSAISSSTLSCSPPMDHSHGGGHMDMTTPECRGGDTAFLTTLAHCIDSRCPDVPIWQLEEYWAAQASGGPGVPAKWDYRTALEQVATAPNITYGMGVTLNSTMLVSQESWDIYNRFIPVLDNSSVILYRYSLIILVVGFATPIATTFISRLPFVPAFIDRISPYLIWPSTVGRYHVQPLPWLLGNPPTIGQAMYITGFFILNLVLSFVGYESAQPHPWGYNHWGELLAYAGYRTGEIAFALLPLTILFSGRNNVLLWLTDWSHSTYILLHRWIARLFALHTILHSVFLLAARLQTGTYSTDKDLPYWQWGIVGTVFVCAMLVFAHLWLRRLAYEIFLISHIIMAVFVVVGSWYHLVLRFGYGGNHEYWLYATAAVWGFERVVRVVRMVKNGVCRATITEVGPNHVRVDITGVRFSGRPGYHGYIYFPTISRLRPWENHPFSANSTGLLRSYTASSSATPPICSSDKEQSGVETSEVGSTGSLTANLGVTLYIRKSTGTTRSLVAHAGLPVLLDGLYHNNRPDAVLNCDRVLLIGGGIGITGLLAFLPAHRNVKLAWSVNENTEAVVQDLKPMLESIPDREIRIGERLDVEALLRREVATGYARVGVVVCGPGGLCDRVRASVSRLGRHEKTVFELEVNAFSW